MRVKNQIKSMWVMLEEVEQDIDGETAEEIDAVGTHEGRI